MGKTSAVWELFKETENKRHVECKLCGHTYSRGDDGAGAGTTCMIRHAKNKHKEEYAKAELKVGPKTKKKDKWMILYLDLQVSH